MRAFLAAHVDGADVLLGSSGSTGAARAVVRSTASWVDSFETVAGLCGLAADSRVWVPGPLDATMNLFAAVLATHLGAATVATPREATHAFLTPTALRGCLDAVGGMTVVVAGDRLEPGLAADADGATVHHYYGAAELSFVAWGGHADDLHPFAGVDVEVRDGEIWARSPYLCAGYAGPAGPLRRTADGFATVGDRGVLDGDRLVVLGRPDAVTTAGVTVLVADVEAVLRPLLRGPVVVLGLPHGHVGEALAAVVTSTDDLAVAQNAPLTGARRPRR
ncbi:MAG: AMP-binding protein, partial [Nocardioidaceae bacterium]|nr:AMP-binding protein [Nocardioidaceae bacterium]